jgi:ribosomal protein S18 acetylase RimI-like enzyme
MKDIVLVNCDRKYWEFVRKLRINDKVIDGFIKTDYISKEEQKVYMGKYSDNYRIALVDKKPAGFIGVIDNDIRVCTHPDYQGKGVGKFMVNECMKIWTNSFAKIKVDNELSIKLFESCGFKKKYIIMENNANKKTQSI